jgi:NAD-dependent dihydropyrimidine dehydrogenase PreA subunit
VAQNNLLSVDLHVCIGCGICEDVCPKGVYEIKNGKSHIMKIGECIKCGACVDNCPVEAINLLGYGKKKEEANTLSEDMRALGSEWENWDGKSGFGELDSPKRLFIFYCFILVFFKTAILYSAFYLTNPRLYSWSIYASYAVFAAISLWLLFLWIWFAVLVITSYTKIRFPFLYKKAGFLVNYLLTGVFKVAKFLNKDKDKISNSFIKVANSFVKATHKRRDKERLLILLPRCLTSQVFKDVRRMGKERGVEVAIVEGGTLARKKIIEYRPTCIIGVACERDTMAGIKDVAPKFSVLGVNNQRPEGPCRRTTIDMNLLTEQVDFFLGKGKKGAV